MPAAIFDWDGVIIEKYNVIKDHYLGEVEEAPQKAAETPAPEGPAEAISESAVDAAPTEAE